MATGLLAIGAIGVGIGPASAIPNRVDLANAQTTIGAIAPSILADTYVSSTPALAAANSGPLVQGSPSRANTASSISLLSMNQQVATQVGVRIANASGTISGSGISVIPTTDPNIFNYAQPMRNGTRFLTAFDRDARSTDFSYVFDVPAGTTAETISGDRIALMPPRPVDNNSPWVALGVISAPWAVDSVGASVSTHYTWSGTTLTQYVEPTASTVFPVLADPAWNYDFYDNLQILYPAPRDE